MKCPLAAQLICIAKADVSHATRARPATIHLQLEVSYIFALTS